MIKLNNKNITYVALADTNNSLKAPKEIWYADTNNSVKLVYRRKDALIEGEDYEKYHWLKGDDSAYIQGIAFDLWNNHLNARIGKSERLRYFSYYVQSTAANFKIDVDNNVSNLVVIFRNAENMVHIADISPYSSMPNVVDFDFYIDNSTFYCNRDGVIHTNSGTNIAIESNWTSIQPMIKSAKISYIRELLPNNTYRSNLIPCKLLKPVPKWLDANGIRRNIGECGMIDLVSGKFYGNVNSVGTFTVENYYERKEWLVGDGSAYIDTHIIVNTPTLNYELKIIKHSYTTNEFICGSRDEITPFGTANTGIVYYYDSPSLRLDVAGGTIYQIPSDVSEIAIQFSNTEGTISLNGVSYTAVKRSSNSSYTFRIFDDYIKRDEDINNCFRGKMSYFKLNDGIHSLNLIPCTLTMDLPASMDANNIARTKGTSGMWDLVSDRFYGNIANSGTFKAVNLAEGVDYEVYQWLRVTSIHHYVEMMTIDINSYSFSFSRKPIKGSNVPYFYTEGVDVYLYSSSANTIRIWNASQGGYYYSNTPFDWGDIISIISSSNGLLVNSQVIPQNTFPCKYVFFGACNDSDTEYYTSSITVDGIERYIPVKLLRSIPAKYDANGIVRQAGECGMYDTVNDKFYGNVASSGTFSVSDDS